MDTKSQSAAATVLCCLILIVSFQIKPLSASLNWLSIAKAKELNFPSIHECSRLHGLSVAQQQFCREHLAFMPIIQQAARLALNQCQSQFANRRWNCSTSRAPHLFAKLPESGIREAAFIYALSSAALAYQITQSCTNGLLPDCSCYDKKQGVTPEGHRWSGCSDNIAYGMAVAEDFLDPKLRSRLNLMFVNLHNFETGRQILEKSMTKRCKCHGISGSCELKSCWRSMPSFDQVAKQLKTKYDEAVQVHVKRVRQRSSSSSSAVTATGSNKHRIVTVYGERADKSELVFLNESPNFCQANFRLASYGTRGRECNKSSRGVNNCATMCCGRPYRTRMVTKVTDCQCVFSWCCSVRCKQCKSVQEVSTCR